MKSDLKNPLKELSKQIGISYNSLSLGVRKAVKTNYVSRRDIIKIVNMLKNF